MNTIRLVSNEWELIVDLSGGRIVSLKNKDKFVLGTFQRIDGKTGNTHLCAPNFAEEGMEKYKLPFHGPFRNSEWSLVNNSETGLEISCLNDGLEIRQIFSLNFSFEHKIIVENKGEVGKPLNMAIHNYLETELGWRGIKLNGFDLTEGIKTNNSISVKQLNVIDIPGKDVLNWQLEGFNYAKLWTGFIEDGGCKMFDQSYACVEPLMEKDENYFGGDSSILDPGEKIEFKQSLWVNKKELLL